MPYLKDNDEDVRYKAIVAIGWLGDSSTINVLENNFDIEKENLLRGFTITAMRQIYFRNPDTKESILSFILSKIKIESDEEVLAIMIAVIQDLTKTKFGLKEDPNTGEISGDIVKSKEKIIKKLIHE
nr:HEAT repeat domain-containing protein [Chryseobacterium capnotolerans]